jgi:hypothetical protein
LGQGFISREALKQHGVPSNVWGFRHQKLWIGPKNGFVMGYNGYIMGNHNDIMGIS